MTTIIDDLRFDQLQERLPACVPEINQCIDETFGADYQLPRETPGAYLIFEDVVMEFLLNNLNRSGKQAILLRLFAFFELMANSKDGKVTDLLRIAILEPLVYRPESYKASQHYMGLKTSQLAASESRCTTLSETVKWLPLSP